MPIVNLFAIGTIVFDSETKSAKYAGCSIMIDDVDMNDFMEPDNSFTHDGMLLYLQGTAAGLCNAMEMAQRKGFYNKDQFMDKFNEFVSSFGGKRVGEPFAMKVPNPIIKQNPTEK